MKDEDIAARWEEFFTDSRNRHRITEIADLYPEKKSLDVNYSDIESFDFELAEFFLDSSYKAIFMAEKVIEKLTPPESKVSIHFRVKNLPKDSKIEIRDLRSKHLGNFIAVEGLVRKATEVRPRMVDAVFECKRCGVIIKEVQDGLIFKEPLECYKEQGGCLRTAASTKFRLLNDVSQFVDTQKIEIQESPEGLRGGAQPQRLVAYTEDDLTGKISPGDRIIINGSLRSTQKKTYPVKSTLFEIFLDINSIELEEHEFEEVPISSEDEEKIIKMSKDPDIYRKITASISPTIYGMTVEKEALALQLFGGVAKIMPDGTHIRGDIHIFLIGDPGTAKSQLLRYISELAPRGIYASGKSSSAAGLTAAAVKDEFGEGRWTLEAGALVLADKGVACVDELDKMSPQDRSSMHEAMEQQRISIAKAGITATLQSRCAVLGAANPKYGRFDTTQYLGQQINIPIALLSRFDLIFTITDVPDSEKDYLIAEHILKSHTIGGINRHIKETGLEIDEEKEEIPSYTEPYLDRDFFRKYVAYAKRVFPVMTKEASDALRDYYTSIRKQGEPEGSSVPITARQLEAFVRLSEASARIRLSDRVQEDDAKRAIRIVEYYLRKVAGEEGRFDIDIIESGTSQSQRERIRTLRRIIKDLAEGGGPVEHEDIIAEAEAVGIERSKAESIIKRLHNEEGWLIESRIGSKKYRVVQGVT
ncbi:MAG: minichromosome maintenance protein MCM [Methanomassiliicoccales archaeon]|nr:MAG: minichromosome maintenance protein MCM [Methanomassiliicoccales archaeon]